MFTTQVTYICCNAHEGSHSALDSKQRLYRAATQYYFKMYSLNKTSNFSVTEAGTRCCSINLLTND